MRQRDQADSVGAIGDYAFSAAVKDGGRAPQGAKTGAAFVVGVALATR